MEKMKDQITKVITEYLQKETLVVGEIGEQRIEFGGNLNQGHFTHEGFCSEVASEIYKSVEERYFKDLEEAKIAHSKAVRLLHGEFAKVD